MNPSSNRHRMPMRVLAFTLLAALHLLPVATANIRWNNPAGGAWTTAANWSPAQVPGSADTAEINLAGSYAITAGASFSVGNLTLGGAGSSPTLAISPGTLNIIGNGNIESGAILAITNGGLAGTIVVKAGGRLDLAGDSGNGFGTIRLLNLGTVRWLDGNLSFPNPAATAALTNAGNWEIRSDTQFQYGYGGGTPVFVNQGTLRKFSGSGTTTISRLGFVNSGSIIVDQGTLRFDNLSGILGGSHYIAQGASLLFRTSDLTNTAPATFTGPGLARHESGELWLGGAALQIASATDVGFGQGAVLVENDGTDAVTGTFASRDEGSLFDVSSRLYRIRYKAGTGNDVVLFRDDGSIVLFPLQLTTNGLYRVFGLGTNFVTYKIEASTNLVDWTEIGSTPANGGGEFQFDDPATTSFPHRLYRAIGP